MHDITALIEESLKMINFDHANVLNLLGVCRHWLYPIHHYALNSYWPAINSSEYFGLGREGSISVVSRGGTANNTVQLSNVVCILTATEHNFWYSFHSLPWEYQ